MFRSFLRMSAVGTVLALIMSACSTDAPTTTSDEDGQSVHRSGDPIPGQYIVVFQEEALVQKGESLQSFSHEERLGLVRTVSNRVATQFAIAPSHITATFGSAVQGVVMTNLTKDMVDRLKSDPRIRYVEQDRWVSLPPFEILGKPSGATGTQPAQTTPWGITKVGGPEAPSGDNVAYIVDTGLDVDHPDLNVLATQGRDFTNARKKSVDDGNGHGTHVGGTVGAKDNSIGVIGVAPGIGLIPMKVLTSSGSGQFSWSIAAFDYIAANGDAGDVVNYSVGPTSRYTSTLIDDAVTNLAAQGIKIAMAAGNANDDCTYYSPARVNGGNIYTIAAMTSSTAKASYSNYGAPVDYWLPGSSVYSTYRGGGYATLSGTSMASPHGCGILAVGGIAVGGSNVTGVPSGTTTNWGQRD